jgi:hypothetical protein
MSYLQVPGQERTAAARQDRGNRVEEYMLYLKFLNRTIKITDK